MNHLVILDPSAPAALTHAAPASLLDGVRGTIVGFIDNTKPNFDALAEDMGELLMREYGAAGVVKQRKRAASSGATAVMLDDLRDRCDLVIAGSGD